MHLDEVRRIGVTPSVAAEVSALPDDFHRDPADRRILSAGVVSTLE